jgi:hypothetical protein
MCDEESQGQKNANDQDGGSGKFDEVAAWSFPSTGFVNHHQQIVVSRP